MSDPVAGPTSILTPELTNVVILSGLAGSCLALALSLFVVLASAWIYSVPSARHHLDRVSFRILLWSMIMEVVYNVCYINISQNHRLIGQNPGCGTVVYFMLASMGVCNWLCTCIGLNLMLAISFGINPVQARLERWYILGSFILGFGVPLVPAILGHFGFDPHYQGCYFTAMDKRERITDFVLDLYFWQILSCLIAAGCVTTVLVTLIRRTRATERALFMGNNLNIDSAELSQTATNLSTTTSDPESSNISSWHTKVFHRTSRRSQLHRLEDKLAGIALRISLYPLALLMINIIITAEDLLFTTRGDVYTKGQLAFYYIHNFLYGGRGIFFALLGIFVDPCLRLGLPAAIRATFSSEVSTHGDIEQTSDMGGEETWSESQSIGDFLSTTPGPIFGDGYGEEKGVTYFLPTPTSRRWSVLSMGRMGKVAGGDLEALRSVGKNGLKSPHDVETGMARSLVVEMEVSQTGMSSAVGRITTGIEKATGLPSRYSDLSVTFDIPTTTSIDHSSGPIPSNLTPSTIIHPSAAHTRTRPNTAPNQVPPRLPRLPSHQSTLSSRTSGQDWLEPLAAAILSPRSSDSSRIRRIGSDPALSVAERRRKELRLAAEEMYAAAQTRL